MAHFAWIDDNNIVYQVSTVDNINMVDENGEENEATGIAYLTSVHGRNYRWVQTSYHNNPINGQIRNYAAIGDVWNGNQFVSPSSTFIE